jgi:ABC-type multidrug transport system fused ATPase/permease subunit
MLKLAARVANLTRVGVGVQSGAAFNRITDSDREQLLIEAVDVFALHLPAISVRKDVAATFSAILGLHDAAADDLLARRPVLSRCPVQVSADESVGDVAAPQIQRRVQLAIGRVRFEVPGDDTCGTVTGVDVLPRGFAPTKHGTRLLETVASCVRMREPTLLVGSTGVGKTTAVQVS